MEKRDRLISITLLALGVPSLLTGLWIRIAPHNFYENFPGFGMEWVSALGPYDGHALTDYGAALIGLSAGLVAVALFPKVRALPLMLSCWLLASTPHLLYHVVATGNLSTTDNALNIGILVPTVVLPAVLLWIDLRAHAVKMPRLASEPGPNSRIPMAPEHGLLRRMSYIGSRRTLGKVATPIGVMGHSTPLLTGYGVFELASMRAKALDSRTKDLAQTRAGMVVGCEYCLDIGSAAAREGGITDDELRELVNWREGVLLTQRDKLALELTDAMTRTPAVIPDELFDRLRAEFDEEQLVELTGIIALENFRARFNWAFGMGPDGFSEGAYCVPPVPAEAEVTA